MESCPSGRKVQHWKCCVGQPTEGSNPSLSATQKSRQSCMSECASRNTPSERSSGITEHITYFAGGKKR